jgi:chromosomal replication initiation ATPase DnaA
VTPRIRRYLAEAAEIFDVAPERITARDPKDHAAAAARTVIYQALRGDGFTVTQIGRWFGRHHTTVISALTRGLR